MTKLYIKHLSEKVGAVFMQKIKGGDDLLAMLKTLTKA